MTETIFTITELAALIFFVYKFGNSLQDYVERKYPDLIVEIKQAMVVVPVYVLALAVAHLAKYLYLFFVA